MVGSCPLFVAQTRTRTFFAFRAMNFSRRTRAASASASSLRFCFSARFRRTSSLSRTASFSHASISAARLRC